MAPDVERRLCYGHSIVGRSGASGCGVRGVWGDEALATQGEAAQEMGVGGGLLAGIGAHHRLTGGLGGHRDRAAFSDGDRALPHAAGALGLVLTMIGAALSRTSGARSTAASP